MRSTHIEARNRWAGAVALAALVSGWPVLTLAQAAAPGGSPEDQLEEMVVVGSRVRGGDAGPSPVTVLDASDIAAAATPNLADLVFDLPQNLGTEVLANPGASGASISTLSQRNGGSAQGGIGAPNLRGLGARATQTLLDGRRLPSGDANATYPQVALERIEVLLDGASALYGSEAIVGVVNFVPRKRFDGLRIDADWRGVQAAPDARDSRFALLAGTAGEGFDAVFAFEQRDQDRVEQRDFPRYLRRSKDNNDVDTVGFPGNVTAPLRQSGGPATGDFLTLGSGPSRTLRTRALADPGCGNRFMDAGDDPVDRGHDRWGNRGANGLCGANFSETLDYLPDLRQQQAYGRMEWRPSDSLAFEVDANWSRQRIATRALPAPLAVQVPLVVPGDLAGNPFPAFVDLDPDGAGPLSANGQLDPGERRLYAVDRCNFVDCTAGDGFPDRDANGDGTPDPSVQGNAARNAQSGLPLYPVLLAPLADRFTAGTGRTTFNEDVLLTGWTPFGKNIQGLPGAVDDDGTIPRRRRVDNLRLGGGVRWQFAEGWELEAHYLWARRQEVSALAFQVPTNFSVSALQRGLGCVNPRTATNPSGQDCLPFNPFSTSQFRVVDGVAVRVQPGEPGYNSQAVVDGVFRFNDDHFDIGLRAFDALLRGPLLRLQLGDWSPGEVQLAAGIDVRTTTQRTRPNALYRANDALFASILPHRAEQRAQDAFVELDVPLLDDARWGQLSAQVAARYTRTEADARIGLPGTGKFDDVVRKVGLLYRPTDTLALRASWSEGFVAPDLLFLFLLPRDVARRTQDPTCTALLPVLDVPDCGYTGAGVARAVAVTTSIETLQGNPGLKPETSDALNAGITLDLLDGALTLQADWFHVEFRDNIVAFTNALAVSLDEARFRDFYRVRCPETPASDALATQAQRDCASAARTAWITTPESDGGETEAFTRALNGAGLALGAPTAMRGANINATARQVTAVDLQASWRFGGDHLPWMTDDIGAFELRLAASWLERYDYFVSPAAPEVHGAGKRNDFGQNDAPAPRWRGTASLGWQLGPHAARLGARYHHRVQDRTLAGAIRPENASGYVSGATYWDLWYQYTLAGAFGGDAMRVSLGIHNLFDHAPTAIEDSGGIDTNLDDPLGRRFWVQVSQTF